MGIKLKTLYILFVLANIVQAQLPTTLDDFFLPGSQPGESGVIADPVKCNCHDFGKDMLDPYSGWQGSMMANSMRDLLYTATLDIANQDADSSGDLCLRCHTPTGWLNSRSVPTDGSSLLDREGDFTGVNCKFCHLSVMPVDPPLYHSHFPDDSLYNADTYPQDTTYLSKISGHIPPTNANGMYVVSDEDIRRGPRWNVNPSGHEFYYSPYHSGSEICGTCHDVSNPVLVREGITADYSPDLPLGNPAPSFNPYTQFPIERTYSEWQMSSYNSPDGVYAPQFGGNKDTVSTCQDCHMKDITGTLDGSGTDRDDLAMHDLTGGNTFMPEYIKDNFADKDVNYTAIDSGIVRAIRMLRMAATLEVEALGDVVTVTVTNETGHKLPSGYPEGRRIWLNVKAWKNSVQIFESGAYNTGTGVLTKDSQVKIYEIKPGLSSDLVDLASSWVSGLSSGPSFHFVLNDTVYSDNRIPPRGFTNANFEFIQSPPVHYTYADGQHWDETNYLVTDIPDSVIVTLYYQTTSKEYIEFLRDENTTSTKGDNLYDYWNTNGKAPPVVMASVTLGYHDISLPIELNTFSVSCQDGLVKINWQTASEIENMGFKVLRAKETEGAYQLLSSYVDNPDLEGLGTSSGGKEYSYIDDSELVEGMTYFYKIQDVSYSGVVTTHGPVSIVISDIDGEGGQLPYKFDLMQNYPNPFNPGTSIPFTVDKKELVGLNIYNISGRLVKRFSKKLYYPGKNEIYWDGKDNFGRNVASGIYYYRLYTFDKHKTKKMILLK